MKNKTDDDGDGNDILPFQHPRSALNHHLIISLRSFDVTTNLISQ